MVERKKKRKKGSQVIKSFLDRKLIRNEKSGELIVFLFSVQTTLEMSISSPSKAAPVPMHLIVFGAAGRWARPFLVSYVGRVEEID